MSLLFFNKILVVNKQIENWFHKIGAKKASYFPNFASLESVDFEKTELKGETGKRIVCLANLREPKNHQVLLMAFHKSNLKLGNWTLHFVGKNYLDDYSENIAKLARELQIEDSVFLYDAKSDIANILSQVTIGVLCSTYEGFPVTLLEYGLANIAVIASNVGFCPEIIKDKERGLLFESDNVDVLQNCLVTLSNDAFFRIKVADNLHTFVGTHYSKSVVISELIQNYQSLVSR